MRNKDEIFKNERLSFVKMNVPGANNTPFSFAVAEMYSGNKKVKVHFGIGFDEDGWEHVSVSIEPCSKTPTWDIMCKVKEIFWEDEEEVIQLHPRKSAYFHGFGKCEVLHLWRPKDGDWSRLNDMAKKIM